MNAMRLPRHVGIIPDGNRRWAKLRGLSLWEGYLRGYYKLREVVRYLFNLGVRNISIYAMSLDNFLRRSWQEVEILFRLAKKGFRDLREDREVNEKRAKVVVLGELSYLPVDVREEALKLMEHTRKGDGGTLYIAFLYSVKEEVRRSIEAGVEPFTLSMPPIDLVIRSGGMRRISGFLPLASVYAELYFTETLWPDISIREIDEALRWYASVQRKFGA
ncbi:polyprenyl diphosphate synthase [Stetteria hydrogenophila]